MVYVWSGLFAAVLLWSGIEPFDRLTWVLEVLPAVLGALALAVTRSRFPLTPLLYVLILAHCVILIVGGHYTYANVPLFDWLGDLFGWERNNYDKLGHFAQGFVPVMIAREIVLRLEVIRPGAWTNFFTVCFALALSAFYELIEWWVALASGQDAEAFLGTQGYVWDTQSDMLWCLSGAIVALLTLSRWHDRQLRAFSGR
ncbi:DUF2238 domain-containing protein [Marinobacter bohaiensis]|uniref:DUF2238 domain-containing protein n=1 Tax=Marinobacter bohaiensis TaxID=2201898 RepID=UPI000DAF46FB|nr:DUF2238 domain-containing protein [Marinobacter bohaiensis]